jgi:hypothetical protein
VVNDQYELKLDFREMRLRGSIKSLHISLFPHHLITLTEAYIPAYHNSDTSSNKLDFQRSFIPNAAVLGATDKLVRTSQPSSHVKLYTVHLAGMGNGFNIIHLYKIIVSPQKLHRHNYIYKF